MFAFSESFSTMKMKAIETSLLQDITGVETRITFIVLMYTYIFDSNAT